MKFAFIAAEKASYPVQVLCLRVPAQGERPDRLNVNAWIGAT